MRFIKFVFPLLVILCLASRSLALPVAPPDLRCASVLQNGDIQISWLIPPDPSGSFLNYLIYGSSTGTAGPYLLLSNTGNYAATNFVHVGAGGHTQSWSYYVITEHNDPTPVNSSPSDTLSSMLLTVTDPANGTAILNWNHLSAPAPPTFNPPFRIHKAIGAGAYTQIATTNSLTFTDTIRSCNQLVSYRIEARDASGCSSFSSINGGPLNDLIGPGFTTIDSVSVSCATGDVVIGWKPNPAPDKYYYIFYKYDASQSPPWVKTDSIPGNQTGASVPSGTDCGGTYSIAAFDTCGLAGLISSGHQAMCLTYDYSSCLREVTLDWNSYKGWSGGVDNYFIFASKDGGPYELVATNGSSDTTAVISNLTPASTYCFYVRARAAGSGFTSSSNCICFFSLGITPPAFHYLEYVTVKPDQTVDLEARVDTASEVKAYVIERADGPGGAFVYMDQILQSQLVVPILLWNDDSVDVSSMYYTYRVIATDSCDMGVDTTNLGRTIHLTGENGPEFWNTTLEWNPYIDWPSGVESYDIYRGHTGLYDTVPFVNVLDGTLDYMDEVQPFYEADGEVCYYVEAQEVPGDGRLSISRSNNLCIKREPLIFIPNAFTPGGLNPIFKPEFAFVDHQGYNFTIYDRWGQQIFQTDDVFAGWTGTLEAGHKAPIGMYIYHLRWKSSSGEEFQRHGHVTLLRHK